MAFIAPLAAILAALAIPILLLYMLRLRRREAEVSSTYLWQQLVRDREANAPWQRLRRSLLLLLQLLILALLVFALMRPFVEVPTLTSGRTVLLLDASASMNATDVEPNRFAVAQQEALDIVSALGPQDSVTVIRVADVPEVLVSASNDPNLLRDAIQSAQPSQAAADWPAALTLAAGGAVGAENFSVVILSDGGLPVDLPTLPGEVRYVPIGRSGDNAGITALSTRARAGEAPQLFAEIFNYGPRETNLIFSLYLDGVLTNAQRYTVGSRTYQEIFVTDLPADFTVLQATVAPSASSTVPDYLALDDTAWAVYNPAGAGRVLLMTPGNLFLRQALASLPGIEAFQGDIENGLPQGQDFDLYVLDGWLPPDGELPDGDLLIVDPPGASSLFQVVGRSTDVGSVRVNQEDPRALYLNFDNVGLSDFTVLDGVEWATPLVTAAGGPLVLAGEVDGRQVAILTFDLHRSDLPLQIAWPVLLANLMQWYTPARAVSVPEGLSVGETLPLNPPFEADTLRITRPDGETTTLNVDGSPLIYADTTIPGLYTVDVYHGADLLQSEPFAVNLFDRAESFIQPAAQLTVGATAIGEAEREEIGQQEFWPILAAIALVVLALEWWLYHRGMRLPRPEQIWASTRRASTGRRPS